MTFDGASLFAGMAVGSVGTGFFIYGKKTSDFAALLVGVVLVASSYFVDSASGQLALGAGIVLVFWVGRKRGLV